MTIQEKAIEQLERISEHLSAIGEKEDYTDMAIKALEQTDKIEESNFSTEQYKADLRCAYDCGYAKALEQQTCIEDYPTCTECEHYDSEKHYCPRFCQVIKDALAEAQPKKGEWIVFRCGDTDTFKCSKCGMRVINPYMYCPNCGAEMDGGGEDG